MGYAPCLNFSHTTLAIYKKKITFSLRLKNMLVKFSFECPHVYKFHSSKFNFARYDTYVKNLPSSLKFFLN